MIAIIAALRAELTGLIRRCRGEIAGIPVTFIIAGVGCSNATWRRSLALARPKAILVVGMAGAVACDIRAESTVIVTEALGYREGQECRSPIPCAPSLINIFRTAAPDSASGALATVDTPVFDRRRAREIARKTGAAAVDMETDIIAEVAQSARVPWGGVRWISDTCDRPVTDIGPLARKASESLAEIVAAALLDRRIREVLGGK